jgi:hypothetical protein
MAEEKAREKNSATLLSGFHYGFIFAECRKVFEFLRGELVPHHLQRLETCFERYGSSHQIILEMSWTKSTWIADCG